MFFFRRFPLYCFTAAAVAMCAGCLFRDNAPQRRSWMVSLPYDIETGTGGGETVRMGALTVVSPYDRPALAVKRADGSVAFDAYNVFAASPSSLLRLPLASAIEASGKFGKVLPSSTSARTGKTIEAVVTDISLDCRKEGERVARVALSLAVLEKREVKGFFAGEGSADASSGDYSAAFSEAFSKAVSSALGKLSAQAETHGRK